MRYISCHVSQRTGKMTRVRQYALALLVATCSLGHLSAFAQLGPAIGPSGDPGPSFVANSGDVVYPYQTPLPPEPDPYYVNPATVDTGCRQVGPLVRTDGAFMRVEYL